MNQAHESLMLDGSTKRLRLMDLRWLFSSLFSNVFRSATKSPQRCTHERSAVPVPGGAEPISSLSRNARSSLENQLFAFFGFGRTPFVQAELICSA